MPSRKVDMPLHRHVLCLLIVICYAFMLQWLKIGRDRCQCVIGLGYRRYIALVSPEPWP